MTLDNRGNLVLAGDFLGSSDGVVSPFLIRTRTNDFGLWPVLGSLPLDRLGPLDKNGPLGLQNLVAYAMGLNPLQAGTADLPQLSLPASQGVAAAKFFAAAEVIPSMKFRYRQTRQATGILTRVMASPDLIAWNPAQILSSAVIEQHPEWEWVEVTVPRETGAKFLRLEYGFNDGF